MFKLPDLPYAYDALQPTLSADTMRTHHDKHHAKYVKTTNQLCAENGLHPESLEALIAKTREVGQAKLFNNAAQAWNHAFFWSCMTPGGSSPDGELAGLIGKAFGGLDELKSAWVEEGNAHFGSGWIWLAVEGGALKLLTTHDGDNLVGQAGVIPLLACDLWEHAYYLDYKNARESFLKAWFDALPDWRFASHQLSAAKGQGEAWAYPLPEAEPIKRQA